MGAIDNSKEVQVHIRPPAGSSSVSTFVPASIVDEFSCCPEEEDVVDEDEETVASSGWMVLRLAAS